MKNEMTMTNAVTLHFWQSSIGPICSLRRLRSDLMCLLLVFCVGGKPCRVGGGRNKEVKLPLSFFFFFTKNGTFSLLWMTGQSVSRGQLKCMCNGQPENSGQSKRNGHFQRKRTQHRGNKNEKKKEN